MAARYAFAEHSKNEKNLIFFSPCSKNEWNKSYCYSNYLLGVIYEELESESLLSKPKLKGIECNKCSELGLEFFANYF